MTHYPIAIIGGGLSRSTTARVLPVRFLARPSRPANPPRA